MPNSCVIGVDLGGTNVRAQALYLDGNPAGERFQISSNAQQGADETFRAITTAIQSAQRSAEVPVIGVGMAVPGHVDDASGIVRWAPNFGETVNGVFISWRNVPLKSAISEATGLPIAMGNDANLAALGEYKYGAGKNGANCLVLLTLGTGIGGGVVMAPASLQGNVHSPVMLVGGNKGGAELGHIIINHGGIEANSGEYGAIEGYCMRDSIVRRAQARLLRGRDSLLRRHELAHISPRLIFEACEEGDELSIEVFREVGEWLGVGIGSLINVFAPDLFCIGGQVIKAGKYLLEPARLAAQNCAVPSLWEDCTLMRAELIEDAGILGGGALAVEVFGAV